MSASSLLLLLVSVTSTPQAVQDTLINVPLLRQPTPWAVVVGLAIVLFYVAVRSGYSVPRVDEIRAPEGPTSGGALNDRGSLQLVLPSPQGDMVAFGHYQALLDKLEAAKAQHEKYVERLATRMAHHANGEMRAREHLQLATVKWQEEREALREEIVDLRATVVLYRERESRAE